MILPGTNALQEALNLSIKKTRENIARLADEPKAWSASVTGNYCEWHEGFFDISNWTTSFFTGMALLGFQITHDLDLLKQVNRLGRIYSDKVHRHGMDTMHDLGFLYSLYSVALWKLTGSLEQRELGLKAAEELAKRFVPSGEYIQAWARMDDKGSDVRGVAIIDAMMNLPLLFWASETTGNEFFREIAVKHANTTARLFVRADDSVCHAYRFDPASGKPEREDNYCGAAVGSHWARGTAWGIYGFALAYRYTGDVAYLGISERLARKFISLLDDQIIPVWDFRAAPESKSVRDASAASIAASALYTLGRFAPGYSGYHETADKLLAKLCEANLETGESVSGLIRNAQIGNGIGVAMNAYTSWGDFYFMEALANRLHQAPSYW